MMLRIALVLALACGSAFACSPAQRENIDKLDRYFGIQPFYPNGELGTNGYSDSYIAASSDLNCNFNTPEAPTGSNDPSPSAVAALCKWKNMDAADAPALDNEQWYIFHKTDKKQWRLLRPIRRTTPAVGDGFALTGGEGAVRLPALCTRYKKQCEQFFAGQNPTTPANVDFREVCEEICAPPPQSVLYSSPLKCLENEAELSFDYWIFSAAGVRVLLLEENTLRVLYEVPKNDRKSGCTRWSPRDGRCKIKIPPQTQPFHLAIQGHDLASKFVIIDNIEFSGNLGENCIYREDPFDFGTTVTALPTRTGTTPITVDSDLNSNGAAGPATRWTNSGRDNTVLWQVHSGPVDADKWRAATGDNSLPNGDFLMARGTDGHAELISDVVDCQQNDGVLTMRAWASPNTDIDVCVVKAITLEPIYACDTLVLPSNGPVTVPIFGPLDDFRIMIVGKSWDAGNGGFVAVDDLEFDAELCTGAPTEKPTDPDKIDEEACQDLSTDFDDSTLATTKWKQYTGNTFDGFTVVKHKIDSSFAPTPNTQVKCSEGGRCAGLLVDKTRQLQVGIMESPKFTLVRERYIEMLLRRGTWGSYVYLCKNELPIMDPSRTGIYEGKVNAHCAKLSGPSLTHKMYTEGEVVGTSLPVDAKQIYLVFTLPEDSGSDRGAFLVDNIRVLRGNTGASGALCVDPNRR